MRADLGWSYLTAGAMNTVNAAGYLPARCCCRALLRRFDARRVLLAGSAAPALLLAAHGVVVGDAALYALRLLTGVASAAAFVAAACWRRGSPRMPTRDAVGADARGRAGAGAIGVARRATGLVLGIYYGGTGLGIVRLGPAGAADRGRAGGRMRGKAAWIAPRRRRAALRPRSCARRPAQLAPARRRAPSGARAFDW